MNTFCPFIKDECKTAKCVMWENDSCLTVAYARHFVSAEEKSAPVYEPEKKEDDISEAIKSATAEQLAQEMLAFSKEQSVDGEVFWADSHLFWESKGIEKFGAPVDLQIKMKKAEDLCNKYAQEEREERERQQLQKEEVELPCLTDACVEWARKKGLKKTTTADIQLFLLEGKKKVLSATEKALRLKVSDRLKSGL